MTAFNLGCMLYSPGKLFLNDNGGRVLWPKHEYFSKVPQIILMCSQGWESFIKMLMTPNSISPDFNAVLHMLTGSLLPDVSKNPQKPTYPDGTSLSPSTLTQVLQTIIIGLTFTIFLFVLYMSIYFHASLPSIQPSLCLIDFCNVSFLFNSHSLFYIHF